MISCNKYFISIILFSLFSSTHVTACGGDGEGSSEPHASHTVGYPDLGKNDCFKEMKRLTGKQVPEVEDMGKVAIRDWTFNSHRIVNNPELIEYYREMDEMLDFEATQSPSEWCGENVIRLKEETFGSDAVEETQFTLKEDSKPSSSGLFGRILRKRKKKEEEPFLTETEKVELLTAKMKADAAKEDQMDNCLRILRQFGVAKKSALKYAFNDITLEDFSYSAFDWDINFRYKYMEYLMNNVKFRPGMICPHDFCYRNTYNSMDPQDERKKQYLNRRKKRQNQS